jgi:hypothetical protein
MQVANGMRWVGYATLTRPVVGTYLLTLLVTGCTDRHQQGFNVSCGALQDQSQWLL